MSSDSKSQLHEVPVAVDDKNYRVQAKTKFFQDHITLLEFDHTV
jgi:hypothetical protein